MEIQNRKIDFNWIKEHAGHHGNELADQLAKETATSREINECYKRIPKSPVLSELSEHSATKWQGE
jgi:ribonuclease HI